MVAGFTSAGLLVVSGSLAQLNIMRADTTHRRENKLFSHLIVLKDQTRCLSDTTSGMDERRNDTPQDNLRQFFGDYPLLLVRDYHNGLLFSWHFHLSLLLLFDDQFV